MKHKKIITFILLGFYSALTGQNVTLGNLAGFDYMIGGTGFNVAVGEAAFHHTPDVGGFNTALGSNAGQFVGFLTNGTGLEPQFNTYLGHASGLNNFRNGFQIKYNTFVGANSGAFSRMGEATYVGASAGYRDEGAYNTFIGTYSGENNVSGSDNTFLCFNSGNYNTSGSRNTFLGSANFNSTGNNNTAVGVDAGKYNSTGNDNTFLGYQAGFNNMSTVPSLNTFLGAYSNGAANLTNATAIGGFAYVGLSDAMVFGTDIVRRGMGTSFPTHALHIKGYSGSDALRIEALNQDNTLTDILVADGTGVVKTRALSSFPEDDDWRWYGADPHIVSSPIYHTGMIVVGSASSSGHGNISNMIESTGDIDITFNTSTKYPNSNTKISGYCIGGAHVLRVWKRNPSLTDGTLAVGLGSGFTDQTTISSQSNSYNNTYLGTNTGYFMVNGSQNIFVGYNSGYNANNCSNIIAIGTGAGNSVSNNFASGSVFIGTGAGQATTTGLGVHIGYLAGTSNVSGNNTFVGVRSGTSNTTGNQNTFTGMESGMNLTTGNKNSFFGDRAGAFVTTGSENVYVGRSAGGSNNGSRNTALGFEAGTASSSATDNIFIGYRSANSHNTGNQNTILGTSSGSAMTSGANNVFMGYQAGNFMTTSNGTTAIGTQAGSTLSSGTNNTFLGLNADALNPTPLINAAAIGANAKVDESNTVVLGDNNGVMTSVCIGFNGPTSSTLPPGNILYLNGSAVATGVWSPSDRQFKTNITDINNAGELISKLHPVTYNWIPSQKFNFNTNEEQIGFIAQELKTIIPQAVKVSDEGVHTVNYSFLIPVLTKAIQEQQIEIAKLKAQLEINKSEVVINPDNAQKQKATINQHAVLFQNNPNPLDNKTFIEYFLPADTKSAFIRLTDNNGKLIQAFPVDKTGYCQLELDCSMLASGTYYYSLIADNNMIDTKTMLVTKN